MPRYMVIFKNPAGSNSTFIETKDKLPSLMDMTDGAGGVYKGMIKFEDVFLRLEDILAIIPS